MPYPYPTSTYLVGTPPALGLPTHSEFNTYRFPNDKFPIHNVYHTIHILSFAHLMNIHIHIRIASQRSLEGTRVLSPGMLYMWHYRYGRSAGSSGQHSNVRCWNARSRTRSRTRDSIQIHRLDPEPNVASDAWWTVFASHYLCAHPFLRLTPLLQEITQV